MGESQQLPWGQATLSSPLDLSHHFSEVTKNRKASETKRFYKYYSIPGMINLAGGAWFISYLVHNR
jgi:hypothetical protein